MFEDTFLKAPVDFDKMEVLTRCHEIKDKTGKIPKFGRINLSDECCKQKHEYFYGYHENKIFHNTQDAEYRLSTQPSLWNKEFLLQYLKPDLSPWDFESQQPKNDGWEIIGMDRESCPLKHNEGVTRHDIYKYNFNGMDEETLNELNEIIEKYDLRRKD